MGVTIVTDSGCDFTRDEAARLGIELVPVYLVFGTQRLRDGVDIDRATFYQRVHAGDQPTTEPATVDDYAAVFAKVVSSGNDAVMISLSGGISASFENAKAAATRFPGKVMVVDSRAAGGMESLLASYAAELAAAGESMSSIAKRVDPAALKTGAYFAVPDIGALGRSGRLPKAMAALGSMLNVSLVLRMNEQGTIGPAGQSFSFDKTCEIMVDAIVRTVERNPRARFAISHVEAPDTAATLKRLLEEKLGHPPAQESLRESTLTIATHLGKGAVGIFAIVP